MQIIHVARQMCGALGEAHKARIIHRDIKPSNIFLTQQDTVFAKLLDFGLVKNLDSQQSVSQTGLVLGSPLYMSPEQVEAKDIDARSDIYALGMTLYHTVTGVPPFTGSMSKILMAHLLRYPSEFSKLENPPDVPALLEWIVFCAIQKSPQDRFQNVLQFAQGARRT